MSITQNQTQNLLEKLKHKRFSSQVDPCCQFNVQIKEKCLNDMKSGFVCSYHPTEIVTNFCVSDGQDNPNPLCPKCLQQHIKSHQQLSTMCKLQTSETEINRISQFLRQKLTKCSAVNDKIKALNDLKTLSIAQIRKQLQSYKKEINNSIESLFLSIETELIQKYEQQNNLFEQTIKNLQLSIPNLQQNVSKSLSFINVKKELNQIILGLPQITVKYSNILKSQKQMMQNSFLNPQIRFNKTKVGELTNCIKNSIEYKFNKVNEFQIEKQLKKDTKSHSKKQQIDQNMLTKLQKMIKNDSKDGKGKLSNIDQNNEQLTCNSFAKNIKSILDKNNQLLNQKNRKNDDFLSKLNSTSDKLKSSLNGFYKVHNQN